MKGKPFSKDTVLVNTDTMSSRLPAGSQDKVHRESCNPEHDPERKETVEEMVRSLQGVFCKGRYHSWMAAGRRKGSV
jgi:hypothetical protein